MGLDYWPLGLVTPDDFHICFRYRNGLHNPDSRQAIRYARARLKLAEIGVDGETAAGRKSGPLQEQ